ncbi:hypothetical protein Bca52824_096528 [Brassica carinata]|uniref:Tubulin-specific chaperone A n=2 Tax=Brassica carinata TaxID=52824 RepID=A0A8X7NWR5_BRACI|nr:hypothetical protein Bca52824_096528 [Brassica carinata]
MGILHSYEKEVEREAAKTAAMKDNGADPYDLKQQENVLGESRMMIPDCHKRLEAALADLKSTLIGNPGYGNRMIVKELHSYEKEVEREAAKTAAMKDNGADPYDLKQQENVLGESRMMIPDCHKRLEAALADLKSTLAELEETTGPEVEDAKKTVADVEKQFPTEDA